MKMGNFEQASHDIREIEWVKQQVKAELSSLQQNVQQELFYQKDGDKVTYNLALVKTYLEHIKEKSWSELTQKNSSAWIMAVQIALESQGYDVGKVDGLWWSSTKAAVENFQDRNGLNKDGMPWSLTIQKLAEVMGTPAQTEGTPAQAAETSAQAAETPAQAAETPAKVAETPAQAEGTPAEAEGTPAEAEGTPAEAEGTPAEAEGTPAEAEGTPAQADGTPAQAAETPAEAEGTPAQAEGTPAEAEGTPAQVEGKLAEKSEKLPQIQLSDLGEWQGNKFIFKEGVEKTDQKGKYIEIEGKRYDQWKQGMTWLGYKIVEGCFEYWTFLNGENYKKGFRYYLGRLYEDYYDENGNQIKQIGKNWDGTINFEWNYEYDGRGNMIKWIRKNWDGTIVMEWNTEYDERGNMIKETREGSDNDNYTREYIYHDNGNQKTEKEEHIGGVNSERDYDENEELIKETKTYYDDKPVIEGKFDDEWELIKEEVEEQEDQATETTYTGQVNATNKQKHGSGRTTFKDKQTEGGYYENGKLLFWGNKTGKDLSQQRGTVKLSESYKVDQQKQRYQDRTVESWGNKISLLDNASGYHFSTKSGAKLTLPKSLWRQKALAAANLINAAVGIVKNSGFQLDGFEANGDILQADYKKYVWDTNLIKNVQEKFWVSATVLAAWMNEYRNDVGI